MENVENELLYLFSSGGYIYVNFPAPNSIKKKNHKP